MITTLFRALATPLVVFLDYVMVPRRTRAFFEYIDEYGDDLDATGHPVGAVDVHRTVGRTSRSLRCPDSWVSR